MSSGSWVVRLSAAAEEDYRQILRWTNENFGTVQARIYAETLRSALIELSAGPSIAGVRERSDIGANIRTLHVARKGHKGGHFLMIRLNDSKEPNVIEVLRILHDSMDLKRHLPPAGNA